jgi:hypothetical protein
MAMGVLLESIIKLPGDRVQQQKRLTPGGIDLTPLNLKDCQSPASTYSLSNAQERQEPFLVVNH